MSIEKVCAHFEAWFLKNWNPLSQSIVSFNCSPKTKKSVSENPSKSSTVPPKLTKSLKSSLKIGTCFFGHKISVSFGPTLSDPRIQGFEGQSPSSQHVTDHHGNDEKTRPPRRFSSPGAGEIVRSWKLMCCGRYVIYKSFFCVFFLRKSCTKLRPDYFFGGGE